MTTPIFFLQIEFFSENLTKYLSVAQVQVQGESDRWIIFVNRYKSCACGALSLLISDLSFLKLEIERALN